MSLSGSDKRPHSGSADAQPGSSLPAISSPAARRGSAATSLPRRDSIASLSSIGRKHFRSRGKDTKEDPGLPVERSWEQLSNSGSENGERSPQSPASPKGHASADALDTSLDTSVDSRSLQRRDSEEDLANLPPAQRLLEAFRGAWNDFELFAEYAEGGGAEGTVYSVRALGDRSGTIDFNELLVLLRSLLVSLSLSLSLSNTHTHTHTHSLSLSLSLTHTQTHTHTHRVGSTNKSI